MTTRLQRRQRLHLALFVAPALVIYAWLALLPLLDSIRLSFFTEVGGELQFIGFDNYKYVLTDEHFSPRFWNAMWNNLQFFLIHLLVQNPIGLALAAVLASSVIRRSRGIYRTLIYIPTVLSVVVVGFIWKLILNPLWGLVDIPLLGLEATALPTLSLISVWSSIGTPMIFFFAVLIAIPPSVLEAAQIDGASAFRTFWSIKLPLILPMVGIITIITFIANFNAFDLVYTVQGASAGPNYSTDLFGTLFYRTFFGDGGATAGNSTLGTTVATLTFLLVLIVSVLYFVLLQRRATNHEM